MFIKQNKNSLNNYFMQLALNQAKKVLGNTKENPAVGCVIVKDESVIAAASTGLNGRPHAEHSALKIGKNDTKNSLLYVTIEPCSNYGKTTPCVNKIIKSKIKKVFYSLNDPDIRSYKKSLITFKKSKVLTKHGIFRKETENFYRSYIKQKKEILPFVTCKLAISKDLFTVNKKKEWITNKYSRGRVHIMRYYHDCILTSSETLLKDNPQLNCRIEGLKKKKITKFVIDKNLSIPINSKVIQNRKKDKLIIFYNKNNIKKINLLKKLKIKLIKMPFSFSTNFDLRKILIKVKLLGYSRIFLESGIKLASNFLNENLIDDFYIFISSKKLGLMGDKKINKIINTILRNKTKKIENVNLLGDKLLLYKMK